MDYLKEEKYYKEKNDIEIYVPLVQPEYPENSRVKRQVMILPLSLEDEVQTCGTASVLKEFAKDLNIKCLKMNDIVFNKEQNKYDIKAARERYIFYKEMEQHQKDMDLLKQQFVSHHRSFPKHDDNDGSSDEP